MYPANQPYVVQRVNGKIVNFPGKIFSNLFPNRNYRRNSDKKETSHLIPQQIFKWDFIHNKPILVKTIYHLE